VTGSIASLFPVCVVVVSLALPARSAAEPIACQREIVKASSQFLVATSRALQRCEDSKVKGRLPQLTDCLSETKTAAKLAKASSRLRASIARKCGGRNKVCNAVDGGNDADDSLASIGWDVGTCPNFESGSCVNAIQDCDDIATCLACVSNAAVDQVMVLYSALQSSQFGTGSTTNKCQRAVGKQAIAFVQAKSKHLRSCWDARLKGKHSNDCPNPGDGRALEAIQGAEDKLWSKICRSCGGNDRSCGGADDLTVDQVGFVGNCPNVVPKTGPACGGPVTDLPSMVACVDCVDQFKADCVDALSVPNMAAYPSDCSGGGGGGAGSTLVRGSDPVVIHGSDIPSLNGIAPNELVAFRYTTTWKQIPVQVDERDTVNFDDVYNGFVGNGHGFTRTDYTDAGTFGGTDSNTTLDADDEIVFMAFDAGGQISAVGEPAGVVPGSGVEIAITDSLDGGSGYVYLFKSAGSLDPAAGQQYVTYAFRLLSGDYLTTYSVDPGPNPEDTTVTTASYSCHFADRWIRDQLAISAGGASGVDILDRHKALFGPGVCGRSEDTFSNAEGAFLVNKNGPVRGLRSYVGANSGPLTQRQHYFYRDREDVYTFLRVHAIQGIMDLLDYSPNAAGMTYYDELNTAGVTIDGIPDVVTAGANTWEMVTGSQGSLVIANTLATSFAATGHTSYYVDDTTPSDTQCTGDAFAYGTSGLWLNQSVPSTDPSIGGTDTLTSARIMYYEAPGLSVAQAEQRRDWALNPLQMTTATWP